MARPDRKRDTNVPSIIAGFYFQIVLACYEICQDGIKEVGVETDADVVTIDNVGEKVYIESKLHAKKFGRFSEDVKKTVYNFYNGYVKSEKIKKMYFVTNVESQDNDKAFFDAWNTGKQDCDEIMYIKEAVLRKSIVSHEECQDCYKQNPLLGKKLTDVEGKIEENRKVKESLDAIFQINQWGSIAN